MGSHRQFLRRREQNHHPIGFKSGKQTSRWDVAGVLRRHRRHLITYLALLMLMALAVIKMVASPWPPLLTIRHILSAPNCNAARAMGLAPARKGMPGYYLEHDRDRDGVACEAFRR